MRLEFAVPAIDDQRHVDIDDVASSRKPRAGDAMADDMVERGADGLGVAAIIQRARDGAVIEREAEHEFVEPVGGDAGLDVVGSCRAPRPRDAPPCACRQKLRVHEA